MSDTEDVDVLLEDIKALEAALAQNKNRSVTKEVKSENLITAEPNLCEPSTSKTTDIYPTTRKNKIENSSAQDPLSAGEDSENEFITAENEEEEEGGEEEDDEENHLAALSDSEAALILNRKIINLLTTAKKRLEYLLKESRRRQALIDEKISRKTTDPQSRMRLTIAGIPYFKDRQNFPAPLNQDAKTKTKCGELQLIKLPCPLRWTLKDRNILWAAIYKDAKSIFLRAQTKSLETQEEENSFAEPEDPLKLDFKSRGKRIPDSRLRNMKHLVGPLGSQEFDWLKIAATDFNGRHSASECRAMWNVFLHPDINKAKWKKEEDTNLKLYAEEYNFQNWDKIASKLKTNRSGYQCFIRFNTNFKNNMFNRISSWSKEEDQKLTDTINALRTGNFIPWGEVAKLMGNRRKQQIYMRWNYSLAPNLKKGRFTEEEDKLLLQGVAKFGSNFTKISVALLPHRNTAQLNDHYRTLMAEKKNDWSYEDDVKLVKLFDKLGNNWAVIAKQYLNKSRVQVRHRHTAIIRYLSKGLSLETIPRWGQKKGNEATPEEIEMRSNQMLNDMSAIMRIQQKEQETVKREQIPNIDAQLKDYFKAVYQSHSKPGRRSKFYLPEELDQKTRKIDIILNLLNADLDIPDDLEKDVFLVEKDKQLLTSLKAFTRNKGMELETRQKRIEYFRRRMFGPAMPSTGTERFVPPLPFNGEVRRCKKTKLVGLNYVPSGDKCLVDVTEELDTPETIISLIGGWENEIEFQHLEKIFIGKTEKSLENSSRRQNCSDKILDFGIPSTSSGFVKDKNLSIGQEILANGRNQSSQTISKKLSNYHPEILIPPNYVTLLGFRSILLSKHMLEADDPEDEHEIEEACTITPEGEKALELFEERLVKLFKFPIELSEIPPPVLHGITNVQFDDMDVDDYTKKRKSNQTKSGSTAKKKAKVGKS